MARRAEQRQQPLTTARLHLRPIVERDLDALHRLWTEPAVRRYLWDDVVISRQLVAEVIAVSGAELGPRGLGYWTIEPHPGGELIGFTGLRWFGEPREVELLYGLHPDRWGQGLATEAARAIVTQAFERAGLKRLYAGADPPNRASFGVMARLGMRCARRVELDGREAIYYVLERARWRESGGEPPVVTG